MNHNRFQNQNDQAASKQTGQPDNAVLPAASETSNTARVEELRKINPVLASLSKKDSKLSQAEWKQVITDVKREANVTRRPFRERWHDRLTASSNPIMRWLGDFI